MFCHWTIFLVQLCFIKRNHQCRYKYLVIEIDSSYFVKHHSDSMKKVIWNWYLQHAWQQICYVWWTCLSKDSRHTYGYKLCSSSRRIVLLFLWNRLHTGVSVAVLDVFFCFFNSNKYHNFVDHYEKTMTSFLFT
jgi:hypothetical protein